MSTIAEVGETVTCESGHDICDVAQMITHGMLLTPGMFNNWRSGREPDQRIPVQPCPVCGASWIRFTLSGPAALHVGDEWRR